MRTDVKVGLICLFAIVLGVVVYFVAQGNAHLQKANGNSAGTAAGSAGIPAAHADNPPPALQVAPVSAGTSTPASSNGPQSLVPANGTAGVSGGLITAPGSSADHTSVAAGSPAPATGPASTPITSAPPTRSGSNIPTGGTPTIANNTSIPGVSSLATATPYSPTAGGGGGMRPTVVMGGSDPSSFSNHTASHGSTPGSFSSNSSTFAPPSGAATTYKIQKGDMLGTVAHKFNVTVKAIEAANPGIDSTRLKIDSTINIPAPSASAAGSSSFERPTIAVGGSPATRPSRSTRGSSSGTPVASPTGGSIKPGSTYTVKKGDTLGTIAMEAYGSKNAWQRIFRANRSEIGDPNLVREGTILQLPN